MSSETPGVTSTSGENVSPIASMSRVRSFSDEITIYEIANPIPSKPILKPLSFELPQDTSFFKTSPIKISPQKLSPMSSSCGSQNPKILSPSTLSILNPLRDTVHSPAGEQLPQFVPSPSSHNVLLIPSKPELTVTVVSSPTQSEGSANTLQTSTTLRSRSPVQVLPAPIPHSSPPEQPKLERDLENAATFTSKPEVEEEKVTTVRSRRQRRVFMPHQQKSMYRTRTMVKASLAAQNEKDELASQKVKIEVPSAVVKPSSKALNVSLPSPTLPSSRSGRKRSQRKLSTAEQLQQLREDHSIDLESPGSILKLLNLKHILTKHNFSRLPLEDQMRLVQLLPDVDTVKEKDKPDRLREDALDNLFYNKACDDWKTRLIAGEFTPESKLKQKQETEREKAKVDPWKKKHFEPIWGFRDVIRLPNEPPKPIPSSTVTREEPPLAPPEPEPPLVEPEKEESQVKVTISETTVSEVPEIDTPPVPVPQPPSIPQSPSSTPGKRPSDSHLIDQEDEIVSKRIRITPPTPSPPLEDQGLSKEAEKSAAISNEDESDNSSAPLLDFVEVEEEVSEFSGTPIPMVDNEVTIENSPYDSSLCPDESPEVEYVLQSVTVEEEDKCPEDFSEEVYVETTPASELTEEVSMTMRNLSEISCLQETEQPVAEILETLPEGIEEQIDAEIEEMVANEVTGEYNSKEEVKLENEAQGQQKLEEDGQVEINVESVQEQIEISVSLQEQPQQHSVMDDSSSINVNSEPQEECHVQDQSNLHEEPQIQQSFQEQPLTSTIFQENQEVRADFQQTAEKIENSLPDIEQLQAKLETHNDQVPNPALEVAVPITHPVPVLTETVPITDPLPVLTETVPSSADVSLGNTSTSNVVVSDVLVSSQIGSIPMSPLLATSPIRLPMSMSQDNVVTADRLLQSQSRIVHMVTLSTPNGPLQPQSSSVRLSQPQQTPLQPISIPISVKSVSGPKESPVVIRSIVPKVLSEFIPVQPRALASTGQQPTLSPLSKVNGPGIPGIQNPSSPGNAKPKSNTVPPGSVNLDRSYEICKQVIENSPNRMHLQKQLVKPQPPPLTPNSRIPRQEIGSGDATAVIQMNRRVSTPTLIQSNLGQMQMTGGVGGPGQKMMLVNHQGMAPLIRPIQQQLTPTLNHHQIVVSSASTSNGIGGSRALGMNVTFTTKHNNPTTNNNQTTTLTSTPSIITPQQLALLLQQQQQQQHSNHLSRSPTQQGQQALPLQRQRTPLFITRPPQTAQGQQSAQAKILNTSQFSQQSRIVSPQLVQFQQSQRSAVQGQQEAMQFPVRAQIMTSNGETLTIHRAAAGMQPVRVTSPIRMNTGDLGKGTNQSLTIINRSTNFGGGDNRVQTIQQPINEAQPSSSQSNPAQNLADFITNQWTASGIRPISPLAFDTSGGGDRVILQGRIPTTPNKSRESQQQQQNQQQQHPSSPQQQQNPSHHHHQLNVSEIFIPSNQRSHSIPNTQHQHHHQQLGLEVMEGHEALAEGQGGGGQFSVIKHHKNNSGAVEFIHIDRSAVERLNSQQQQQQHVNSTNTGISNAHTNHNYPRSVVEGGGSLVQQSTRVDGQGDPLQQQHYVIVQTTGSNGMPQNLVLQASLLMPPQQIKEESKDAGGPPRAASAPPTNPTMLITQHQQQQQQLQQGQSNCNVQQENKLISLPVAFQDFSGLRVFKDESGGSEDSRRMDYCMTNTPPGYTLTPVSSAPGPQEIVRVLSRSSTGSPDVWNYSPVPSSGHIVNVNLNGSSGSARIIPGQHPVISIPDTTNGSSSCSGMSSDFDLFSAIASTGGGTESIKVENNGDTRSILIPMSVAMTNNNRQHFHQPLSSIGQQGPSPTHPSSNQNCICDLRAMTTCRKCGAYSHSDCIMKNGMELCTSCVIR